MGLQEARPGFGGEAVAFVSARLALSALDDCYRILALAPGASPDEIRRAWRALVREWHPDRLRPDDPARYAAEEYLKRVNEAYTRLLAATRDGAVPGIRRRPTVSADIPVVDFGRRPRGMRPWKVAAALTLLAASVSPALLAERATPREVEAAPAASDPALQLRDQAREWMAAGDPRRAATALRQAVTVDPRSAAAWHELGDALQRLDRVQEALVAYEAALRAEPSGRRAAQVARSLEALQDRIRRSRD